MAMSYFNYTSKNQSEHLFCVRALDRSVCVTMCVVEWCSARLCECYLFFHQLNFQLFIHSKGYLFLVHVIFVIALVSDCSQTKAKERNLIFCF